VKDFAMKRSYAPAYKTAQDLNRAKAISALVVLSFVAGSLLGAVIVLGAQNV
jgi:hypothetical protein